MQQEKVAAREIAVHTYTKANAHGSGAAMGGEMANNKAIDILGIDESKTASTVDVTETVDESTKPHGLSDSVMSALPPTLRNFTLVGKVAVITG